MALLRACLSLGASAEKSAAVSYCFEPPTYTVLIADMKEPVAQIQREKQKLLDRLSLLVERLEQQPGEAKLSAVHRLSRACSCIDPEGFYATAALEVAREAVKKGQLELITDAAADISKAAATPSPAARVYEAADVAARNQFGPRRLLAVMLGLAYAHRLDHLRQHKPKTAGLLADWQQEMRDLSAGLQPIVLVLAECTVPAPARQRSRFNQTYPDMKPACDQALAMIGEIHDRMRRKQLTSDDAVPLLTSYISDGGRAVALMMLMETAFLESLRYVDTLHTIRIIPRLESLSSCHRRLVKAVLPIFNVLAYDCAAHEKAMEASFTKPFVAAYRLFFSRMAIPIALAMNQFLPDVPCALIPFLTPAEIAQLERRAFGKVAADTSATRGVVEQTHSKVEQVQGGVEELKGMVQTLLLSAAKQPTAEQLSARKERERAERAEAELARLRLRLGVEGDENRGNLNTPAAAGKPARPGFGSPVE